MSLVEVNSIKLSNTTFNGNTLITNVDCNYVSWVNNSMTNAFNSCSNLTSISNINENVINMDRTFQLCSNLVDVSEIPNGVESISEAFRGCSKLVNIPSIPNSVTTMKYTFMSCLNIVNAPNIPNSVYDMSGAFYGCHNLVNPPIIPNSVGVIRDAFGSCTNMINAPVIPDNISDMCMVFRYCYNLVNVPNIPNNTTNMAHTFLACFDIDNIPTIPNSVVDLACAFQDCYNLNNIPNIPTSVVNMSGTFYGCSNLHGNIFIQSPHIINTLNCFHNTSLTKNVFIPFKYENSEYTSTYNSFINNGYDERGTTNGVYLRDINSNYYTLTINHLPSDAIVEMSCDGITIVGNTWSFKEGSTVSYTVSCEDYKTATNTITLTKDTTIDVVLESELFTVSINPTPSNATVILTADGYTQEGNSIKVKPNTTISYSVSAEGYTEQTGIYTITSNLDLNIVLEEALNTKYNVEDYTYTVNNKILTLTNYIGSETDIVVPIIEQL